MAEYIDRDALMQKMLAKLRDWKQKQVDYDSFVAGYAQGCIDVENAPVADVAEVKHGEWIKESQCLYSCSLCGDKAMLSLGCKPCTYCPSCGAKMDGKGGK